MNENKKAALKTKILACFHSCELKEGWPEFSSYYGQVKTLSNELEKAHKDYIEFGQTHDLIRKSIRKLIDKLPTENQKSNSKLSALISEEDLTSAAEEMITFIQTLPRTYYIFFHLPQLQESDFSFLQVTEDIKFIRVIPGSPYTGSLVTLGYFPSRELTTAISPGSYIRIAVKGYSDKNADSLTTARGISKFKQLIYMCLLNKKMDTSSYFGVAGKKILGDIKIVDPNIQPSEAHDVGISTEFAEFLASLIFTEAALTIPVTGQGLLSLFESDTPQKRSVTLVDEKWANILRSDEANENASSFKNALEWGFDSQANRSDQTLAFIQLSVALEAVLGIDTKRDGGLTSQLADRAAYLVGNSVTSRKQIRESFVKFYDVRSRLVHGRDKRLNRKDQLWFFWGQDLLDKILRRELLFFKFS